MFPYLFKFLFIIANSSFMSLSYDISNLVLLLLLVEGWGILTRSISNMSFISMFFSLSDHSKSISPWTLSKKWSNLFGFSFSLKWDTAVIALIYFWDSFYIRINLSALSVKFVGFFWLWAVILSTFLLYMDPSLNLLLE